MVAQRGAVVVVSTAEAMVEVKEVAVTGVALRATARAGVRAAEARAVEAMVGVKEVGAMLVAVDTDVGGATMDMEVMEMAMEVKERAVTKGTVVIMVES